MKKSTLIAPLFLRPFIEMRGTKDEELFMQISPLELTILANTASAVVSLLVALFLIRLWYHQESRMYTDLPFIFALTFLSMVPNMAIQAMTHAGLIELTMDVFRLRAIIISGSALPLLAALQNIWLPRFQKYHTRIMIISVLYWGSVALLGPTEVIVMGLLIPLLLAFSLGMLVTFAITWKTGRLEEVRSDLMVVSLLIGFVSQALKIPMQAAGFDFIIVSIAAMTAVLAGIALANPWYHRSLATEKAEAPDYISVSSPGV